MIPDKGIDTLPLSPADPQKIDLRTKTEEFPANVRRASLSNRNDH